MKCAKDGLECGPVPPMYVMTERAGSIDRQFAFHDWDCFREWVVDHDTALQAARDLVEEVSETGETIEDLQTTTADLKQRMAEMHGPKDCDHSGCIDFDDIDDMVKRVTAAGVALDVCPMTHPHCSIFAEGRSA